MKWWLCMSTTLMRRPPMTTCRLPPAGAACCDAVAAAVNPRLRRRAPAVAPAAFRRKSLRFGTVLSSRQPVRVNRFYGASGSVARKLVDVNVTLPLVTTFFPEATLNGPVATVGGPPPQ